MKRLIKNRQVIDGLVVTLLGLWLLVYAVNSFLNARVKAPWIMSPYLFPMILAGAAILLGLIILIPALVSAGKSGQDDKGPALRLLDVIVVLCLSILYDIIMRYIGFIPATILLLLGMIAFLGERRVKVLVPIAVLTPVILTLIFKVGLGVRLP